MVPFNLTLENLKNAYTPICPILGIELNWYNPRNEGGRAEDTPALDRIGPKKDMLMVMWPLFLLWQI